MQQAKCESPELLLDYFNAVRGQTLRLIEGLSAEDLCAQSMPDASPGKWHLAHTTWFFETFILLKHAPQYREFHSQFNFLFNSYYENVGSRHARPQRGLLTRPSLAQVLQYRDVVDAAMRDVIAQNTVPAPLIIIGLHHEMQHQELLLTDLLHLLSHNALFPRVLNSVRKLANAPAAMRYVSSAGGLVEVGHSLQNETQWQDFSYDCEQPKHSTYLAPFTLASRLVTNAEWLDFIADGGYQNSLLWLSDGWSCKQTENWHCPLYWQKRDDSWWQFGLNGFHQVDLHAPVSHVSYYEAEAFARWAGKRLPREHEWELAAQHRVPDGNFLENNVWHPQGNAQADAIVEIDNLYGDVWEWTQSSFSPYPGFQARQGALGEYNGKFMSNQFVLKGGSCVTPKLQMRASYRNFFYPHQRWQFTGVRLADDE